MVMHPNSFVLPEILLLISNFAHDNMEHMFLFLSGESYSLPRTDRVYVPGTIDFGGGIPLE